MKKNAKLTKVFFLSLWAFFYILGLWFAPFITYSPNIVLSCIFFFCSTGSVFWLNMYEYRSRERSMSIWGYILNYWMAYLAVAASYVRILIVS